MCLNVKKHHDGGVSLYMCMHERILSMKKADFFF